MPWFVACLACASGAQVHWKNSLALWAVPRAVWQPLPLFLQSWLANCVLCYVEYFLSGALWALWVYKCACAGGTSTHDAARAKAGGKTAAARGSGRRVGPVWTCGRQAGHTPVCTIAVWRGSLGV